MPVIPRRFAHWGVAVVALELMSACNPDPGPLPEPVVDPRVWQLVRCIECINDEQRDVVAMGEAAIPALRYFLLNGPPDTTRLRQDSALRAPIPATSPVVAPVILPAHLIDRRIKDFVASYRMRASLALGLIGTDSARRVLCAGKAMQFRDDVKRFIDSSLALLNGSCP